MVHSPPLIADERTILITGCSSGIGFETARVLRGRNWRVFVTARNPEDVERLLDLGFEAFRLDYEEPETIETALAAVLERTGGRLTALYNNGAYAIPGAIEDLPVDALKAVFQANFFGWHELTQRVIPIMREQKYGRIVQCSSILGFIAMKYRGAYTASKFALEAYSDTLRQELKGTGIMVSLVEPGPIDTRFTENALSNFDKWITSDIVENSPHRETYKKRRIRMEGGEPGAFKLKPLSVAKRVIHAVEASRPKPRYYVTVPTYMLGFGKRLMSTRLLDRILVRAADSEE
ncbi:MAG: SDR family NAD(P)-dependent oxidoreductase [Rhodobacteraceae bacterium]|nr:SDR family NAD(P)-dependent oxidoreductase [Paracoccaceae bacterium]